MLLQALCIISYPLVNSNWSYSPETPNLGQIWRSLEPCDLEIWRMTLPNNRDLFSATSSFVHHFIPIGKFKFQLQSGNAQFGSKSMIFLAVWPWNSMDDLAKQYGTSSMLLQALYSISWPLVNSNWSYSPETPNLGQIRRFLEPCDLEIWRMTLQNNRTPLLSNIKLYVPFHHHMWIQSGGYSPETVKLGRDLCDLHLWPLTLTFCMDLTLVLGDNSWNFHNDTMMGT